MPLRRALIALAGLFLAAPQARADAPPVQDPRDPRTHDRFGDAVVVVGDQLLVGAPGDNDAAFNAGAVYVFEGSALVDKLFPADHAAHAWFGGPIAADGDTILVGGVPRGSDIDESVPPQRRSAAILRRRAEGWVQEARLVHGDPDDLADAFGAALALAGDHAAIAANFVQIGDAYGGARVDLFHRSDRAWELAGRIYLPAGGYQVDHLALTGDHLVIVEPPLHAYAWVDGVWVAEDPPPGPVFGRGLIALPGDRPRVALADGDELHIFGHEGAWRLDQTLPLPGRITSARALAARPGRLAAHCEPADPLTGEGTLLALFREEAGAWLADGEPLVLDVDAGRPAALAVDAERLYLGLAQAESAAGAERGAVQVWVADTGGWSIEHVLEPRTFEPSGCRLDPAPPRAPLLLLFVLLPAISPRRRARR